MNTLDLELSVVPGHAVGEAVEALESVGLQMLPGHEVVPMKARGGAITYVVTLQDPWGDAQSRVGVLAGVANVVGFFGNPEIAPFA